MSAWTMMPARSWSGRVVARRGWRSDVLPTGGTRVTVPPSAAPANPLRITARGRLVLVVAALVLGVMVGLALGAANATTSAASGAGPGFVTTAVPVSAESTVVVRPGDTLWSIAERTFPGADPREAVVAFRNANGSQLASLQVGQRLVVPARL